MDKEEIIKLYQQGYSISKLDRQIPDLKYEQIRQIPIRNGVEIRGGRKTKELSDSELEQFKKMYYEDYVRFEDIAKTMNMDPLTLHYYMRRHNLPERQLRTRRVNINFKDDYFETIDTYKKAYYLGLLFADGSVRKVHNDSGQIRIYLQAQDKYILEEMAKDLGYDGALVERLDAGNHGFSLEANSNKMFYDLAKYGIVPNKTYETKHLPTNIPEEFIPSFALGLLDGDGCLSFSDKKYKYLHMDFTSYYESMVTDYRNMIDKLIEKEDHRSPHFNGAWHITWSGNQQVVKILDILYEHADVYLTRKHDKYLEMKEYMENKNKN